MRYSPYILGSGKAAQAIIEAIKVIEVVHPEISFNTIQKIKRGEDFPDVKNVENAILFIANPHALHTDGILKGETAGFRKIITEKPAATSLEQIKTLRAVKIPVGVCHGYRQMWGIQTLKSMIKNGEFGKIISIEGRYWQSSSAQKALSGIKSDSWKNNPEISGPSDVLMDLATHWIDAAIFLAGSRPEKINLWKSHINAEAPHRDTHVQVIMDFPGTRAMASVSKTVHGSPNHFEMNIIGEKKFGTWKFLEQDLLEISEGSTRTFITRSDTKRGSGHWPHHSLGWLEGYVEVIYQYLTNGNYPTLQQNLDMLEIVLS